MKQILLNSAKNNENVNVENSVNTELSTKYKILPNERIEGVINHYEVYLKERNECKDYKLFFTLHPYMTNVLFNAFTEIIYHDNDSDGKKMVIIPDEGNIENILGKKIKAFNERTINPNTKKPTRKQCIKDSECSHPDLGNLEYRCGIDIFNNPYLRSDGFFCMKNAKDGEDDGFFNTIEALQVYSDGNVAKYEKPMLNSTNVTETIPVDLHLFNHENMRDFKTAFVNGIKENNGWIGFYNKAYAPFKHHVSGYDVLINKCLNNKNACEFIDMYPDRTLFSFLPKINLNYLEREEYNWEWALTYPSTNVYDFGEDSDGNIIKPDFFDKDKGLTAICMSDKGGYISRDSRVIYFRTKCKHNLNVDDIVKISYDDGDFSAKIIGIGDRASNNKEYYFALSYDDLVTEFKEDEKLINQKWEYVINFPFQILYVSKLVDGTPCKYYMRYFQKIDGMKSSMNRMAFSKTIYGDDISQIIYGNNLNTTSLKDNLGRELSEVYLTIVKKNEGAENYYGTTNGIVKYMDAEGSSCFGKVTSGFEFNMGDYEPLSVRDFIRNFNVHMIHNVETGINGINVNEKGENIEPSKLCEDNILSDGAGFIGDFVEFSPVLVEETVLEEIHHRFNTVQREKKLDTNKVFNFKQVEYNDIEFDDYDADDFNVETISGLTSDEEWYDNIFPEGYYYKPHYRVKLKEFSPIINFDYDIEIFDKDKGKGNIEINFDIVNGYCKFITEDEYHLIPEDRIVIWYTNNKGEEMVGEFYVNPRSVGHEIIVFASQCVGDGITINKAFIKNPLIPDYAYNMGDGSGKYVWRELINDTELDITSDIYNRMYGNGALYINSDINFYLKRQDPKGIYGLQYGNDFGEEIANLTVKGIKTVIDDIDYKINESDEICEN